MDRTSRNYGIDLLRVVSILGVVFLHVLGHGGLLYTAQEPSRYALVWFLEILAFPAVNCFVLISGYVGYREDRYFPRLRNIISLWLTVLFYSVLICLIFRLLDPQLVGMKNMIKAFIPVLSKQYWFFTAYFGMFLLSPMLNLMVHRADKKQFLLYFIVLLFFCASTLLQDPFSLDEGFSVMWFALLYVTGAAMRKYSIEDLLSKKGWGLVVLAAFLLTWLTKLGFYLVNIDFLKQRSSILVSYTSPTVLAMAIGWFGVFSKVRIKKNFLPLVNFLSGSAFSVYLIHDNLYVRAELISNVHKLAGDCGTAALALFVPCCVIVVFCVCTLADRLRILLFKAINVDKAAEKAEKLIKSGFDFVYGKLG